MSGSDLGDHAVAVDPGRVRVWLGAILLVALLLRTLMAVAWPLPLGGDEVDYDRLGISIAAGRGIVDETGHASSFRPPAYPALVGAVYALAGARPTAVRLVQTVAGTLTVLLIFVLARTLFGAAVALVAAALVAVDFGQIALTGRLLSEGVFTTTLIGLVLASVELTRRLRERRPTAAWAAATGALAGLGALLRGVLLPYPLLLALVLALERRRAPVRGWRAAGVVLAAWGLVLAPWTLRNAVRQHAFVPVTTQVGITFYSAQNPPRGRLFGILARDSVVESVRGLPEPEQSGALLSAGLRTLTGHPGKVPRLEAMKALFFWVPFDWEVLPRYGVLNPSYVFVLFWGVVAAVLATRRAGTAKRLASLWPVWLPAFFLFGMALVFYGSPRMRLPVEPLLALPAAWALTRLAARVGPGRCVAFALVTFVPLLAGFALGDPVKAGARAVMRALGLWS